MRTRFVNAWKTGEYQGEYFDFESPAALFRVLSPKRWELLEKLQAEGPIGVRALARAVERDVRRVHDDVRALIAVGLVEKDDKGKLLVPFEEIQANFALRKQEAA
jgi:predicted transcriptional regulator